MKYGKGYQPNPPDVPRRPHALHLLGAYKGPSELPKQGSLLPATPNPLDQGQTGSCVGHATAGAIDTRFRFIGQALPVLPSPICIYAMARMIDRPQVDPLPPLLDNGCNPDQAMRALESWGAAPADVWGDYPADPNTINNEPMLKGLEAASDFKLTGQYGLNEGTATALALDIAQAISAGYPVCAATGTGDAFQAYTGGVFGNPNSPLDHYIFICGYNWDGVNINSMQVTVQNSWGNYWGDFGRLTGDINFIGQLGDVYVLDVSKK